jgi:transposase InsO family protein
LAHIDIDEDTVCAPLSADCFAIACRATDALEQAIWQRKTPDNKDLVHHSDRGSQYLSIKYAERLAEAEIDLSVGTVGDAYDNALAECVIGLFKTEVLLSDSSNRLPGNASTESVHGSRCAKSNGKR